MAAFIAARWPGNIRQLIHEVERAVVACDDKQIELHHLSAEFQAEHLGSDLSFLGLRSRVIEVWERAEILRGLERTNWNVAALAEEVDRAIRDPAATRGEAYTELRRRIGDPGKRVVFDEAWRYVDFTSDPVRSSIDVFEARARKLALIPAEASTTGLL